MNRTGVLSAVSTLAPATTATRATPLLGQASVTRALANRLAAGLGTIYLTYKDTGEFGGQLTGVSTCV